MFGPTCASNITFDSFVVIIVSAQNGSMSCQTHALHGMLISHGLLYMVMSKGLHVTDVMYFTHATGLCVAWIGLVSVRITGVMGANVTIHLSKAPVRLHYTCPIYHSLHSNWEGFKDSSISADSGHERVGMMGVGGGGSPSWCSCIYTSPEASCVSKIPTQYCGYTHG